MTVYEKELQTLKAHDEVQMTVTYPRDMGYSRILTAGHGYLIVPKGDKRYRDAVALREYGYIGDRAVYLEEDCEAPAFIQKVTNN
jgi:hypothetical protein